MVASMVQYNTYQQERKLEKEQRMRQEEQGKAFLKCEYKVSSQSNSRVS